MSGTHLAFLLVTAGVLAAGMALVAWRFPRVWRGLRVVLLHARFVVPMLIAAYSWPSLAASSGLGKWKTFTRGTGDNKRQVEKPVNTPGTRGWRTTPAGFEFTVRHRHGQSIETVRDAIPELRSGLKGTVRVLRCYNRRGDLHRHKSRVVVNRRNPFTKVPAPLALSETRFRLGVLEDGREFVHDFGARPHLLIAGETGAGKSGTESALLAAVAPTSMVVAMIDLKHGVSAEPYRPRASLVAETCEEAAALLGDVLDLGGARAALVKAHCVDKIDDLPAAIRPKRVLVVVDEIAEMALTGDEAAKSAMNSLLRAVQTLRFAGIHIVICGQRFGSALGKQITSIRAQLSGRICLRVADRETGDMAIGDLGTEAVQAALDIAETEPGVAVVKGGPDGWQIARSAPVSHARLAEIARQYAENATPWEVVMGEAADTETTTVLPVIGHDGTTGEEGAAS